MYEEQIKLKVDSPISWFAKESVSLAVLPYAWVTNKLKNKQTNKTKTKTKTEKSKKNKKQFACIYFQIGKVQCFTNSAMEVT